jgi:hypothetical protein
MEAYKVSTAQPQQPFDELYHQRGRRSTAQQTQRHSTVQAGSQCVQGEIRPKHVPLALLHCCMCCVV